MKTLQGKTAVITGAASGFGLETAKLCAQAGMKIVMADVQPEPLNKAAAQIESMGAKVLPFRLDVSKGEQVEAMGRATFERFGAPHVVFNNAGISAGGLIWEHSARDWDWIVGVNLMGVAHGIRVFTPMMLDAAKKDAAYEGHIVNTASMAGMVNMPNMGSYNVTKNAVVAMSETLFQDLALVTEQIHCSVLCPFYVPTGIINSQRLRPAEMGEEPALTKSQLVAKAFGEKAVSSGKVTAADVAKMVIDAIANNKFYIFSHPHALGVVQTRLEDIMLGRNPSDPYKDRPQIGQQLRDAIRNG